MWVGLACVVYIDNTVRCEISHDSRMMVLSLVYIVAAFSRRSSMSVKQHEIQLPVTL